jgi:hypothetical protein
MTASLAVLIGLMAACVLLSLFLGESPIAKQNMQRPAAGAPSAG